MDQNLLTVGASPQKRRAALPRPGCSDKYARVARSSPGSGAPLLSLGMVSNRQRSATPLRPGVVINMQGLLGRRPEATRHQGVCRDSRSVTGRE
jgi:hypothetical protein